jgi:hypothetical protein
MFGNNPLTDQIKLRRHNRKMGSRFGQTLRMSAMRSGFGRISQEDR